MSIYNNIFAAIKRHNDNGICEGENYDTIAKETGIDNNDLEKYLNALRFLELITFTNCKIQLTEHGKNKDRAVPTY